MKVCFVSFEYPPDVVGGAGTYAETLVNGLRSSGVDVYVITRGQGYDHDQKTYKVTTPNVQYWRRLFFIKPATSLLRSLNKSLKFDIVHFNEPHLLLGKTGLPTVCTFHYTQANEIKLKFADPRALGDAADIKDLIMKGPIGSLCDIFTAQAIDRILCPSPDLARQVRSYCFVEKERVRIVPNGIDFNTFDRTVHDDPRGLSKYDLNRDEYILFVGRLTTMKGAQFLIKAFKAIKRDHTKLRLAIVGTGDQESYLKSLARGEDEIIFTGYIDSLKEKKLLYDNCIAVIVPSLYEGLPMVILEAMACRKAVVASDVGGIPLLVRHGKNGFLTKPGDSVALEKFIRVLLDDVDLRRDMGFLGRELAEKEFSVSKMVDSTIGIYKSLL